MQYVESDPQGQLRAVAFREGLERAGWVAGRNINVDYITIFGSDRALINFDVSSPLPQNCYQPMAGL
jgi:hypothetical protein